MIIIVQALDKIHQTFKTDLEAEKKRIDVLHSLADELRYEYKVIALFIDYYYYYY